MPLCEVDSMKQALQVLHTIAPCPSVWVIVRENEYDCHRQLIVLASNINAMEKIIDGWAYL